MISPAGVDMVRASFSGFRSGGNPAGFTANPTIFVAKHAPAVEVSAETFFSTPFPPGRASKACLPGTVYKLPARPAAAVTLKPDGVSTLRCFADRGKQ